MRDEESDQIFPCRPVLRPPPRAIGREERKGGERRRTRRRRRAKTELGDACAAQVEMHRLAAEAHRGHGRDND